MHTVDIGLLLLLAMQGSRKVLMLFPVSWRVHGYDDDHPKAK